MQIFRKKSPLISNALKQTMSTKVEEEDQTDLQPAADKSTWRLLRGCQLKLLLVYFRPSRTIFLDHGCM